MSAPVPTLESTGALLKTSASGPMPTSRYCDHKPCCCSTALRRMACSEPGLMVERSAPIWATTCARMASALAGSPSGLLFDHTLEHAVGEGDAGRLDDLRVAGRQKVSLSRGAARFVAVGQQGLDTAEPLAGQGLHGGCGSASSSSAPWWRSGGSGHRHHRPAVPRATARRRPAPGAAHQSAGKTVVREEAVERGLGVAGMARNPWE